MKRWTRKVDIFSFDLILVPVHLGMHWCLATIDLKRKAVFYYDSSSRAAIVRKNLQSGLEIIITEHTLIKDALI